MVNILEVKNLCKSFKDFKLDNVNFNLKKGYIMGFIGPNGAGKTTTIKLIMNLISKDSGSIRIFGRDNIEYENELKNRLGFVYDESHLYEELSGYDMKKLISPFYSEWDDNIFHRYIKDFSIPMDKKIKEYSRGMKMKYSLAMALSHNADLFILDEPTSGLDPVVRDELLDILYDIIQDENKGVFFSTHITSDLDKIADYITFLNNGKIVLSDTKDNIIDNYIIIKGEKNLLEKIDNEHIIGIKKNSFGFEALVKRNVLDSSLKEKLVSEIPDLEDIMLYFTKRRRKNV